MHPSEVPPDDTAISLEQAIGMRVVLTMEAGPPWYGHRIAGELSAAPPSAPAGSVKMTHDKAGDVILLPSAVRFVRKAKASE